MDYEDVITRAAAFGAVCDASDEATDEVAEDDTDTDAAAEARWQLIRELHQTTDRDAFEAVVAAAKSDDRARRLVGLDALGQISYKTDRPYLAETLPVLLDAVSDQDAEAVASAVTALGHVADPRGLPAVLQHVGHADDEVRFAVAVALPALTDSEKPAADVTDALITLTRDPDPEVRDWATFGLGTQLHADGPEVRDALAARLADDYDDAAEEAMMGLARRGDPRARAALLDRLCRLADDDSVRPGTLELFEAVAISRTTDALPPLRRLWQRRDGLEPSARRMLAETLATLGEPVEPKS
ncbi:HEAT repeat domain-containing protein [Catenulispora pinisilvae]|uniref:HEAT repeat domain-containing protein n=1 Tax=Catenulispora pinisilvae TaxID=2705253 RepID=UPI0018927FDD|nr:HEAT repeat domain-containing protein [Catenulispora pinisilvae]